MLSDKTPPTIYNVELFIDIIKKRLNDTIYHLKEITALQTTVKEKSPTSNGAKKERFFSSRLKNIDK